MAQVARRGTSTRRRFIAAAAGGDAFPRRAAAFEALATAADRAPSFAG
jgi:hypothetical protein